MHATHHLTVTVSEEPAVLERIVSACRSRQCTIVSLQFSIGDRHRRGQVELILAGPSRMVDLAARRLDRLIGVLAVVREGERRPEPVEALPIAV